MANHLATSLIGRQLLQPFLLAIKHAHTRGAIYFMSTKYIEITIHLLHVYTEMGCALGSIHQDRNIMSMGYTDDITYGIYRSQYIADMGDTYETSPWRKERLKAIKIECSIFMNGDDLEFYSFLVGLQLPRHDIGMMLHGRDDDFITFLHESITIRRCHEIDAFGGTTSENYLCGTTCIDKGTYSLACRLM